MKKNKTLKTKKKSVSKKSKPKPTAKKKTAGKKRKTEAKKSPLEIIIKSARKLNMPEHPRVNALAIPNSDGSVAINISIPFGLETKTTRLVSKSLKVSDAISKVEEMLKNTPTYKPIAVKSVRMNNYTLTRVPTAV